MKVVFRTIISPEFKFDEKKQVVAVRMGGVDFGEYRKDCARMTVERYLSVYSVKNQPTPMQLLQSSFWTVIQNDMLSFVGDQVTLYFFTKN